MVIALPVSWFPLAADYTRHARTGRAAFAGTAVGYGTATIACFTLGVLALAAYGAGGLDVVDALLAVPLGAVALAVLVVVEVDEAFANIYSTAVSAQNLVATARPAGAGGRWSARSPRCSRWPSTSPSYEPFLFLIGAVFVPLVGVFAVAYFVLPRGALGRLRRPRRPGPGCCCRGPPGSSPTSSPCRRSSPASAPGWTAWWAARQARPRHRPGQRLVGLAGQPRRGGRC